MAANNDYRDTFEDQSVTIDVLANDTNVDGILSVSTPEHGLVFINKSDNTLLYFPDPDWNGTDSFTYTAGPSSPETSPTTATVQVYVIGQKDLYGLDVQTNEDSSYTGSVLYRTSLETTPDSITYGSPSHGTVTGNDGGFFTYTPDRDYTGTDSFTYRVLTRGTYESEIVYIEVLPVNDRPAAVDDYYAVDGNNPYLFDPLTNDIDYDGDDITLVLDGFSAGRDLTRHGSITVLQSGAIAYTPNANFVGQDTWDYTITDPSGERDTGRVTFEVNLSSSNVLDTPGIVDYQGALEGYFLMGGSNGLISLIDDDRPRSVHLDIFTGSKFIGSYSNIYGGFDTSLLRDISLGAIGEEITFRFVYTDDYGLQTKQETLILEVDQDGDGIVYSQDPDDLTPGLGSGQLLNIPETLNLAGGLEALTAQIVDPDGITAGSAYLDIIKNALPIASIGFTIDETGEFTFDRWNEDYNIREGDEIKFEVWYQDPYGFHWVTSDPVLVIDTTPEVDTPGVLTGLPETIDLKDRDSWTISLVDPNPVDWPGVTYSLTKNGEVIEEISSGVSFMFDEWDYGLEDGDTFQINARYSDRFGSHTVSSAVVSVVDTTPPPPIVATPEGGVLWGTYGNDLILGGNGDDLIYASSGDDNVYSGEGNDRLYGWYGEDYLWGGSGDDKLYGGFGDDILAGDEGNDLLLGGYDNDFLYGGIGDDKLYGWSGDDYLSGSQGNDYLSGGWGDDILRGGTGDDEIYTGLGNDVVVLQQGGVDTVYDFNVLEDSLSFYNTSHTIVWSHTDEGLLGSYGDPLVLSEGISVGQVRLLGVDDPSWVAFV